MRISLQFFASGPPNDYPDLNKCPDCETFFASLKCPLCGKECPEEMRAGKRKRVKQTRGDVYNRGSGRVQFVPWYYSEWFIILMLFFMPVVGLILLWMGYWRKHWKIIATVITLVLHLSSYIISPLLFWLGREHLPVDTDIPQGEYIEMCEELPIEALFREPERFKDAYVKIEVQVVDIIDDINAYDSDYPTYYRCVAKESGKEWEFLIRDFRQKQKINLAVGDTLTVYGQVLGNASVQGMHTDVIHAPSIGMVYAKLNETPSAQAGLSLLEISLQPSKIYTKKRNLLFDFG